MTQVQKWWALLIKATQWLQTDPKMPIARDSRWRHTKYHVRSGGETRVGLFGKLGHSKFVVCPGEVRKYAQAQARYVLRKDPRRI